MKNTELTPQGIHGNSVAVVSQRTLFFDLYQYRLGFSVIISNGRYKISFQPNPYSISLHIPYIQAEIVLDTFF